MQVVRLSENKIDEVVSLANEVFRPNGGSMKKDYPLLFSNLDSFFFISFPFSDIL